ncbi:hypothetical protein [Agrococcus sp. ProA11]|uniref:hypothetical protein n=1 Tax=Agrococcus chionoecetis TaxID=3153752 RepID=UPI003260FFA8
MTGMHDREDFGRVIRRLEERVRMLETASPLNNASISHGSGIAVRIPAGVHIEDAGSVTAGAASMSAANGGRVGAGSTYIRPEGIWDADGTVKFLTNVTGIANATFDGVTRGKLGVEAPIDGVMTSLGPAVKEADRKGQSGYDNAMAARSEAAAAKSRADLGVTKADDADAKGQSAWNLADAAWDRAGTAQAAANAAQSTANGRATVSSVNAVQADLNNVKNGNTALQSPTLVAPKVTGITSGSTGNGWSVLLVNNATGALRFLNQA